MLSSCDNTRHLTRGQILINKDPVIRGNHFISSEILQPGIKVHSNKQIVFPKLLLTFYNFGLDLEKSRSPLKKIYKKIDPKQYYLSPVIRWFRDIIGEQPNLVDSASLAKDAKTLQSICYANGYLDATVSYKLSETIFSRNVAKTNIVYEVTENAGYIIREIKFKCSDSAVKALVSENSLLQVGNLYNESTLIQERERISQKMRDNGYLRMSAAYISYIVDTSNQLQYRKDPPPSNIFKIFQKATPEIKYLTIETILPDSQDVYHIRNVTLKINQSSLLTVDTMLVFRSDSIDDNFRKTFRIPIRKLKPAPSIYYEVNHSVFKSLNMNFLNQRILLRADERYALQNARQTQQKLQDLGILKRNILSYDVNDSLNILDVTFDMILLPRLDIRLGAEVFQTEDKRLNSSLPGVGGNIQFRNKNLFKRAEQLNISGNGNVSFYKVNPESPIEGFYQYGGKMILTYPRLLFPIDPNKDLSKYNPITNFSFIVNNENRREFLRTSLSISTSYIWYHIPFSYKAKSIFTPINFSIVNSDLRSGFLENLNPALSKLILRDFSPRLNSFSSYYFFYTNKVQNQRFFHHTFKVGGELGGNIPFIIDWLQRLHGGGDNEIRDGKVENHYTYGQFLRLSADLRFFIPLSKTGEIVIRNMLGWARGLNFTKIVPFENRFYSGGINSVRGWQSNTLGPGRLKLDDIKYSNLVTPGGEYLFEFNVEWRQDLVSFLELAVFTDMGNVWFSKNGGFEESAGKLSAENLKLGIASGIGLRFDFSFLILRMDLGQQIFAPDLNDFVVKKLPKDIGGSRFQYNIGIGYPF